MIKSQTIKVGNGSVTGRLTFYHYWCWCVGGAVPVKNSTGNNNFLGNTRENTEITTSTGTKFWLCFCLSVLVLVILKSPSDNNCLIHSESIQVSWKSFWTNGNYTQHTALTLKAKELILDMRQQGEASAKTSTIRRWELAFKQIMILGGSYWGWRRWGRRNLPPFYLFFLGAVGAWNRDNVANWRSNLETEHILAILRGWVGFQP